MCSISITDDPLSKNVLVLGNDDIFYGNYWMNLRRLIAINRIEMRKIQLISSQVV